MAAVYATCFTQGAVLVVSSVNSLAVCNPDGTQISGGGSGGTTISGPLGAQVAAAAVAVVPAKVTQTPGNLAASATINIPVGSVGWAVVCFTGTISITVGANAATALPAGFSASDPNIVGTQIAVTAASASTGYVQFGT